MKNNNMVRTAHDYYLKFKDEATVWKFLFLYKDLFESYSEQTIRERKSYDERHRNGVCVLLDGTRYSPGDWKWLRCGFDMRFCGENRDRIKVYMKPENFKIISGQFTKTKLERGRSLWVFNGEL